MIDEDTQKWTELMDPEIVDIIVLQDQSKS
jgi:hypothetical protein